MTVNSLASGDFHFGRLGTLWDDKMLARKLRKREDLRNRWLSVEEDS